MQIVATGVATATVRRKGGNQYLLGAPCFPNKRNVSARLTESIRLGEGCGERFSLIKVFARDPKGALVPPLASR